MNTTRHNKVDWKNLDKLDAMPTQLINLGFLGGISGFILVLIYAFSLRESELGLSILGVAVVCVITFALYALWSSEVSTELLQMISSQPWCDDAAAELRRYVESDSGLMTRHYQKVANIQKQYEQQRSSAINEAAREREIMAQQFDGISPSKVIMHEAFDAVLTLMRTEPIEQMSYLLGRFDAYLMMAESFHILSQEELQVLTERRGAVPAERKASGLD